MSLAATALPRQRSIQVTPAQVLCRHHSGDQAEIAAQREHSLVGPLDMGPLLVGPRPLLVGPPVAREVSRCEVGPP